MAAAEDEGVVPAKCRAAAATIAVMQSTAQELAAMAKAGSAPHSTPRAEGRRRRSSRQRTGRTPQAQAAGSLLQDHSLTATGRQANELEDDDVEEVIV